MRGKASRGGLILKDDGITPAYAGKSALRLTAKDPSGDHPRMCGEKASPVFFALFLSGSPPRVRGKVSAGATLPRLGGITPACAGKSTMHLRFRVSGSGSPPRVRGKVALDALPLSQ